MNKTDISQEPTEKEVKTSAETAVEESGIDSKPASEAPESDETVDKLTQENGCENGNTDIETMIAEAEERGYMRGRNESIAELMKKPGVLERMPEVRMADDANESEVMVLAHRRVSIWDK